MTPLTLTLDFPPKELSPNYRQHHMALARAKKAYRDLCFVLAKQVKNLNAGGWTFPLPGPVVMDVAFFVPGRYRYDTDGLISRMKAGIDGIVSAGVLLDDNSDYLRYGSITIAVAADPRVEITLKAAAQAGSPRP